MNCRSIYAADADGHPAQPPPAAAGHEGASPLLLPLYPSVYQPPLLRENAAAEISFLTSPPQLGHSFAGSSENFWRSSNW